MQLLFRPEKSGGSIESYGLEHLGFRVQRLTRWQVYKEDTAGWELGIVILGGKCTIEASNGRWPSIGDRPNVFSGLPYALYLPIATQFTVIAESDCELAMCYCHADQSYPPRLVTPQDIEVEIRGGGNATRQINHILKPEFPAQRLLIVEVYTPSGNWSSYPPHKHDVHNPPAEVDLEEIYYYQIDRPEGYAIQRVYSAELKLNETLTVRDRELVLIPAGYHPVVAAHGYNVYYLNSLAGSARSMAASVDPDYAWVRQTWRDKDPRLPMVTSATRH
jgi:5-deoxy-glucuronate isomerase